MVQAKLMTMGCTVEGHVERLMLAVSIPASADIQVPMSFLAELEERELLEYEEAIFRSQ